MVLLIALTVPQRAGPHRPSAALSQRVPDVTPRASRKPFPSVASAVISYEGRDGDASEGAARPAPAIGSWTVYALLVSTFERRRLLVARAVRAAVGRGQDRVAVVRVGAGVVLAVADGAGGMRGGAEAADRAVHLVTNHAHVDPTGDERAWAGLIARIDADAGDQS